MLKILARTSWGICMSWLAGQPGHVHLEISAGLACPGVAVSMDCICARAARPTRTCRRVSNSHLQHGFKFVIACSGLPASQDVHQNSRFISEPGHARGFCFGWPANQGVQRGVDSLLHILSLQPAATCSAVSNLHLRVPAGRVSDSHRRVGVKG